MPRKKDRRPSGPFEVWVLSRLAGMLNRLMTVSCRIRLPRPTYGERRRQGEDVRCIYAAWHSYLWHGTIPLEGQDTCVMVSSHRDGEVIAQMLARRGFELARGSSTRGGVRALRDFARAAREGTSDLVVTIDGPQGPPRKAKTGALYTSSLTGIPIVPMGMWIERCWRMRTWDRLLVGKPFARVSIYYGDEIHIPRRVPREELEGYYRDQLERAMQDAEEAARKALLD